MGTGSFLGVKSGRGVTLTPHPLLVPWSWKSRAIPLLPLWAVRPVQSLSACTRVTFTFLYTDLTLGKVQQTWTTCTAGSIVGKRHKFAAYHLSDCLRVVCRLPWRMVSLYANKYKVTLNESPWPLHEQGNIFQAPAQIGCEKRNDRFMSVCLSVSTWKELSHHENFNKSSNFFRKFYPKNCSHVQILLTF